MPAVEVNNIVKAYKEKKAVNELSFSVNQGEMFGLIGPNGAGKTTTIRMLMDIIKPDSGSVSILGEKLSEASKNRLGYLPEERGLYKKLTVMDSIIYLSSLKGVDRRAAEARAGELLEETGMLPNKYKRIEELSRGMGQIIQFVTTIIHDPELIILDEPFSGLDPVNTELLKNMLFSLRDRGKAIIFSTHQMSQVEELCDRVLMINQGRSVLYGSLVEIKSRFKSRSVILEYEGALGQVPGVKEQVGRKGYVELVLDGAATPKNVLEYLVGTGVSINRFEIATPSLNEIFLELVGKDHA